MVHPWNPHGSTILEPTWFQQPGYEVGHPLRLGSSLTNQHVRNTISIPYPVPSNNGQRCNTNCNDVTTSILGRPAPTGVHAHEDLKTMRNCAWTQGTSGLGRGLRGHLCPDHNFFKSKSSNSPQARPPAMGEAHQQQKQPRMLDHTWPASWAGPACCCWCTRADQPIDKTALVREGVQTHCQTTRCTRTIQPGSRGTRHASSSSEAIQWASRTAPASSLSSSI